MSLGVTDRFRAAYAGDHTVAVSGSIYTEDGELVGEVTFDRSAANSVNVDVTAANRRSCSVSLVDDGNPALRPVTPYSATALTNELRLFRGIDYGDGTNELLPLGVFGIQDAFETDSPAGPAITVTGIDRSKRLDVILTHALSFPAGTAWDDVFAGLSDASGVIFDKSYDPSTVTSFSPALAFHAGDNIWQQIQTAANSLGLWAYFDETGVQTIIPIPDPSGADIDWAYTAGAEAMFDQTTRRLALEDGSQRAYSHAIVESTVQATGHFLRSDFFDTDQSSPTYYLGPFGDRAIMDGNVGAFIHTAAQCATAAAALLRRSYGILERVTLRAAPNPALVGGDIISIVDPVTDTNGIYITESFAIPLFAVGGTSQITCRSRQLR